MSGGPSRVAGDERHHLAVEQRPDWLAGWCRRELGAAPAHLLLRVSCVSKVVAMRLEDGREVVVKARPDERGRAWACVAAQDALARRGFPCARPLSPVTLVGGLAVHAEQWRPGGEIAAGDDPAAAARSARLLAQLVAEAATVAVPPPLPSPLWVRWDQPGPGLWAPDPPRDALAARRALPYELEDAARRVRRRMARARLPCVLGHADWEAQNLRWRGEEPYAVHDWDSLAWLPEAALAGVAAGAFASGDVPTLAPPESSAAFLAAYERGRGRAFTADEREVAWGASLWPALHNARGELLHGSPSLAATAVEVQAPARLERAGA